MSEQLENLPQRRFVDGHFGQLHCRSAGSPDAAETVVCLHMSPKSGRSFAGLMPHLAAQRRVLAPDYPGYGESARPPAEPAVSIDDYAEAVWQCIDALGSGVVHLVGYHTGSMVAAAAASQRPAQVRSIVSISAPIFTEAEVEQLQQTYAPIELDEAGKRFRTMWERILFHRGPGMTLEMAADSLAENLRGGEAYEWGHRAAFNFASRYRELLEQLEQPMLVINPNDDCYEQTRRVDRLLRNGKRIDFPHWGHGFLQAYPNDAAEVMNAFFASLPN